IELLAVIVILAIIALIAVPIIIDIIEDSKKEALKRSAENYLKAVELAIAKENLNGEFNPNSCTIESGITRCDGKTLNVSVDGELPDSGTIILTDGIIVRDSSTSLKYSAGALTYESGKLVIKTVSYIDLANICKVEDANVNDTIDVGEKATCQVNNEKNYTFYVLSREGSNVNLILDRNVYYNSDSDYGLADETNKGLVAWISKEDYVSSGGTINEEDMRCSMAGICSNNEYGPVTALTYLYNATKNWTNVPNINLNYTDNENRGITGDYGYTGIETTSGVTKIKDKSGNYVTGFELTNLKARLPKYSEVSAANGTNSYLYDNLDLSMWMMDQSYKPENYITGIYGYWSLASSPTNTSYAFYVNDIGNVSSIFVDAALDNGVRPVITLNA
ncbi:MAG: hypothetical protein Q4E75_06440, partial [bacterium]|nr:hypothetical protein [bacterium]